MFIHIHGLKQIDSLGRHLFIDSCIVFVGFILFRWDFLSIFMLLWFDTVLLTISNLILTQKILLHPDYKVLLLSIIVYTPILFVIFFIMLALGDSIVSSTNGDLVVKMTSLAGTGVLMIVSAWLAYRKQRALNIPYSHWISINLRPFARMLAVVYGVVCGVGLYLATKNMALSAGIFLLITVVFDWLLVAVWNNRNKET